MGLAIDACSIILLAKATVLEEFAKWKKLLITKGVYNEVLEGKDQKFPDALMLEKLTSEKKIAVKNKLKHVLVKKFITDFGLGLGEAESMALALELPEKVIITDNKQGRKAAKIYGLNLVGSIDVIKALYQAKRINSEKAINTLKTLKRIGWFYDYLIENAMEEIKNG